VIRGRCVVFACVASCGVRAPAPVDVDSVDDGVTRFLAALTAGELDDVDRLAEWLGTHVTAAELRERLAEPVAASAVQIDHGVSRCLRSESGAPPRPVVRTKTMRFPSGDQRGEKSRPLDGASQTNGVESLLKTPIQA